MASKAEEAGTPGDTTGDTTPRHEPSVDLEKSSSLNLTGAEEPAVQFERPISGWQWTLVCVGLFLGALLYGKFSQGQPILLLRC
jgi:hypothetical protein